MSVDLARAAVLLARKIPYETVMRAADALEQGRNGGSHTADEGVVSEPPLWKAFPANADPGTVDALANAASVSGLARSEIAAVLRAAAEGVRAGREERGDANLVWTGPDTGGVPVRATEQVMVEVIQAARHELFLASFVVVRADAVMGEVRQAIARGVQVRFVTEPSVCANGVGEDPAALRSSLPGTQFLRWSLVHNTACGVMHMKCALADDQMAFLTSANLTGKALERNMELGLLLRGGPIPPRLRSHFRSLLDRHILV